MVLAKPRGHIQAPDLEGYILLEVECRMTCSLSLTDLRKPYFEKANVPIDHPARFMMIHKDWDRDRRYFRETKDGGGYLGSGFYKMGVKVCIYAPIF